ncbi:MAG: hypothetical protein ABR530_04175 [Pyrinomonadaceae bacterium]
MKGLLIAFAVFCSLTVVNAQPRPVEKGNDPNVPIPSSFEAKYEGGIFGATGREKGTLKFDDTNERVIFFRKSDQREMFAIPYSALIVIYPDSKVSTSQTGNVVSRLPLPGAGLAGLLSTRAQYLIINFDDADIEVKGTANFKFDDKKMLLTFINALGTKAKMKQRGDAYYRAKGSTVF